MLIKSKLQVGMSKYSAAGIVVKMSDLHFIQQYSARSFMVEGGVPKIVLLGNLAPFPLANHFTVFKLPNSLGSWHCGSFQDFKYLYSLTIFFIRLKSRTNCHFPPL